MGTLTLDDDNQFFKDMLDKPTTSAFGTSSSTPVKEVTAKGGSPLKESWSPIEDPSSRLEKFQKAKAISSDSFKDDKENQK